MLFLKPPFHLIEGIAVFADHEREDVFHYAPAMPHLTMVPDANGDLIPQISLLKFRGGTGGGGFLSLSVDLSVDDDKLDEVKRQFKAMHQLRDDPIPSPILFEDGTVKLIALGAESDGADDDDADDDDDDTDDGAPKRFVVSLNHHSKPALYGANNAIFSVALDEEGVQLVEAALKGEMLPIGVIYSLDFYALRPAFRVNVRADWARVQEHFEESFSADYLFSSVEISTVVDKLVEDQVVTIEVDTFLPEGEEDGSWIGHRDQALEDFKNMVTQTFFEPSLDPMGQEDDGWEDGIKAASQVGLLLASGGIAGAASFSYKKIDITRIDQKSINLTMNERISVKRSMYPQAHLAGLFRTLRDAQGRVDMSRFVTEVSLDDDWFKQRRIIAHPVVDFARTNIESLNVSMRYGGRTETVRLTATSGPQERTWLSQLDENRIARRPVEFDYTVTFSGVDMAERPGRLTSPTRFTDRDDLEIAPQNEKLFFIDEIVAGATKFPWDKYPTVELQFRYRDEANGIDLDDSFLLKDGASEITWKRFRMDEALDTYQVRKVFHAADGRDRTEDWQETSQQRLLIKNPLLPGRTLSVIPAVPWPLLSMVLVELSYTDSANDIHKSETLFFMDAEGERGPKDFKVDLADETKRFIRFAATFLLKDNREIKVPPSETQASTLVLRMDMKGRRVIEVLSPDADFAARGVSRIEAELSYEDPAHGLSFADRFRFDGPGQSRVFEYEYADPARGTYRLKTLVVFENGMSRETEFGQMIENPLRLQLGA